MAQDTIIYAERGVIERTNEETAQDMIAWMREGLSMREISEISGVSRATLYRMYDGKATRRTWEKLEYLIRECISMQE